MNRIEQSGLDGYEFDHFILFSMWIEKEKQSRKIKWKRAKILQGKGDVVYL